MFPKPAFGQPQNTNAFSGFGPAQNTTSPFGQSSFGAKPATAAFGQQPSFGQQSTLFGASQPSTLFSGTSTAFGATTTTQSGFGAFSQPQQIQNTSLFGTTQPAPNQNSLFNQSTSAGAFGAKAPAFGSFNQPQQNTLLFGQTSAPSAFNSFAPNTNSSLFGTQANTSSFGQINTTSTGTGHVKYQPLIGNDTLLKNGQPNTVNTKQHCITAMKDYESKSLEELRFEDYTANRKGPSNSGLFGQQPQTSGTGLFGAQGQSTSTLFNQPNDPNKTLFGAGNSFGQTNTGFGQQQNQQQAGGFFQNKFPTPGTSALNSNTTTFGGFGTTADNSNAFGAKPFTATSSAGMFGQQNQTTNTFGQPTNAFGGFSAAGQPAQTGGLFGGTAGDNKGSFFNSTIPTTNTGFSGFNSNIPTSSGNLFGNKPATGFGATGFGAPTSVAPAFGSAFGTANNTNTLFNNSAAKPGTSAFGNFGQTSTSTLGGTTFNQGNQSLFGGSKPGGLFGNTGASTLFGTNTNFGLGSTNTFAPTGNTMNSLTNPNMGLGQQPTSVPIHQQILAMTTSPYGDNPIFKDLDLLKNNKNDLLKATNPIAQKNMLDASNNQFKINKQVTSNIKARPIGETKKSLFDGLEGYDSSLEESFNIKRNPKRLIIKTNNNNNISLNSSFNKSNPKSLFLKSKINSSANDSIIDKENIGTLNSQNIQLDNSILEKSNADDDNNSRRESWIPNAVEKIKNLNNSTTSSIADNTLSELLTKENCENYDNNANNSTVLVSESSISVHIASGSPLNDLQDDDNVNLNAVNTEIHPAKIVLKRAGYYTIPSSEELKSYVDEKEMTCIVPNFTIGREGYGNVYFNKPIDVYGINFDEIVHFRNKEVIIYPNDENKPAIGVGLNRDAQVTLDQVWPHDKFSHKPIKDADRLDEMNYEGKLRSVCDKYDTRFIEYRPETGSWVFKVKHFSKYGLSDSDEENENAADPLKVKQSLKAITKQNLQDKSSKPIENGFVHNHLEIGALQDNGKNNHLNNQKHLNMVNSMDKNTNKLQLMKASFFVGDEMDCQSVATEDSSIQDSFDQIVPDNVEKLKLFDKSIDLRVSSTKSSVPSESMDFAPSTINTDNGLNFKNPEPLIKIPNLIMKPAVGKIIDMNKFDSSVSKPIEKCISDMGMFHCRRFKVSFGINNSFVIPGIKNKGNYNLNNSSQKICLYQQSSKSSESIVPHLKIQLKHCLNNEIENSDCPHLTSGDNTNVLKEHLKESKINAKHISSTNINIPSIWSLLNSLWGDIEDSDNQQDSLSHANIMRRREIFSDWLEFTINDMPFNNQSDNLTAIFENLLHHKVQEACNLALDKNEPFLALILSQISGGPKIRQLIENQLQVWQKVEAEEYVDMNRLKLFMLVAGIEIISSTYGPINIMERMHWLKAVAVQLWYISSPNTSITDALMAYDKFFNNPNCNALPPVPDYLLDNVDEFTKNDYIYDIRYHMLQLYSKHSYPIENLINPLTLSVDPADFGLSWLIFQSFETLGYKHCSKLNKINLNESFANQLENNGLWEWSIFVLLHIRDIDIRELLVQNVLLRNISIANDINETEKFVINHLGVPRLWIDWAKALKTKNLNYQHLEVKYLLKAKQWQLAHQLIMKNIAADAIINEQHEYLHNMLIQLRDMSAKKLFKTPNWAKQGQILLDFIELNNELEKLKIVNEDDLELKWEQIKPQFFDLCSRINLLVCSNAKQRLSQSEMAQKLACFIRGFYLNCPSINASLMIKLALEKLPLPQEFAQQELRVLLHTLAYNMK